MRHSIALSMPDLFAGWPANNGLWAWADGEILAGCVTGGFISQPGHNLLEPYTQRLLRCTDGGETWQIETPAHYVGDGEPPCALTTQLDFTHPDIILRVAGAGYHGSAEPRGAWYASHDRGKSWSGPWAFNSLHDQPQVVGESLSPRTDYLILGPRAVLFFLSVQGGNRWATDRAFCAFTGDGGLTFAFRGWLTPTDDLHRSVMPSSVRLADGRIVSAVRRRRTVSNTCWIDCFTSEDEGFHWRQLGKVSETGTWNGNPPALQHLSDGRLCCVYGDRSRQVMAARYSSDGGQTWPIEMILRADFYAADNEPDFGYPRLTQLPNGDLLAVYYWATASRPQQHIAVTRWQP
jgi:hypothetical protein